MRQPLIAGNWKMNGSKAETIDLLNGIKAGMGSVTKSAVAVCPPLIITTEQIDEMLDGLQKGLDATLDFVRKEGLVKR